ncbi:MAG: bifunctional DNA-binding transcriptional regulator/O6-methylguanine-DNA methyltransferase Ada [Chloroflexi bacterium]|nr:bifunctional DNA-binding transcriptional regulator/O6-methylguanine-DNA methyltransferase Ada [Chloroflexota bacterium]
MKTPNPKNPTPKIEATDEKKWQAILNRDARMDGLFFTGVLTTKIYCRPSCPAKTPLRKNVKFFDSPIEAERAGLRACKRCHPKEANGQAKEIQNVCAYIESHLDDTLTLEELSRVAHLSPYHLQRTFKRTMGISPKQYANACRVEKLKSQLKSGDKVTEATFNAGYKSMSRVYEKTKLGMTPTIYRRGGDGMTIRYTVVGSSLGKVLVAATEVGICFISLGESESFLLSALRGDYYAAQIARDDDHLKKWVSVVIKYLDGEQPTLNLPLDIRGTTFQRRVWNALQKIPYGKVKTYGEIAKAIGMPKAARAVGHACGSNPVSLVIPCHRAVGSSGNLTGYRWGVDRKKKLLKLEKALDESTT